MNKFSVRFVIISSMVLLSISQGWSAEVAQTQENTTSIQNTTVQTGQTNNAVLAQAWGLTLPEWQHYQQLMQGPAGKWYPQLSPAAILGMNATTPQEQQHFAEIVAKEEHDKLAQELRFNNAVHAALLRLYPNELPIQPFDMSAFNPNKHRSLPANKTPRVTLQSGDHIALFIDPNSGPDFLAVPTLLAAVKTRPGITLDIFCVGKASDNLIRQWALLNHIPLNLVSSGKITLNRDAGKLAQVASGSVTLPYVILVRNQHSYPLSMESLA